MRDVVLDKWSLADFGAAVAWSRRPVVSGAVVRGDMRPDLRGQLLELTQADTSALGPDQSAIVRVVGVFASGTPGIVLVVGDWAGPGGHRLASVAVRAAALPSPGHGRVAGPDSGFDPAQLVRLRKAVGVPLWRVARVSGVSRALLSRVEEGEYGNQIPPAVLAAYELATGITLTGRTGGH